jgi:hypothetical protein
MHCWTCGTLLQEGLGKLSFRAVCDRCGAALHCCQNCKYYKVGRPNDCMVPGTEWVADRSANNFCEEFSPLGKPPSSTKDDSAKKRFDDLFK